MPTVLNFNDVLQADVMWLRRGTIKYAIMSLVDSATRYTAAVLINSEHTDNYIKALERAWIAHFGPPATLLTDEGRGWHNNLAIKWMNGLQLMKLMNAWLWLNAAMQGSESLLRSTSMTRPPTDPQASKRHSATSSHR